MKEGKLLLVDDDRHVLDSMASWLREQGFHVDVADSFDVATSCIDDTDYDLAIVDIRLGDRDGFDLLAYCCEHRPSLTVILITGYGTVETGVEALRAGAFDLLTKPLLDQELFTSFGDTQMVTGTDGLPMRAMAMTFVSALVLKKPILVLVFILIQFLAFFWYSVSFIPLGRTGVKFCLKRCVNLILIK